MMTEITKTATVWVAWTNTDRTEGRGSQVPRFVCETKATAKRLGKKGYVQGSDCPIEEDVAILINNQWYIPGVVIQASKEDIACQEKIDRKSAAIQKAKDAGLTDDEIEALSI